MNLKVTLHRITQIVIIKVFRIRLLDLIHQKRKSTIQQIKKKEI